MRRERIREEMRETGWKGAVIKLLNFIFLPLRYPLMTLCLIILAVLLYIVPTFFGAEYGKVHLWYLSKLGKFASLENVVNEQDLQSWKNKTTQIAKNITEGKNIQKPKARKSFKKATDKILNAIDVLKNEDVVKLKKKTVKKITTDKFGLTYLSVPQKISAENVVVLNANELVVGQTRVFLHGIYVNPQTQNGMKANDFLVDLVGGKTVDCMLVAYTKANDYTAICFVGDVEINRLLVDKGYSENKALK